MRKLSVASCPERGPRDWSGLTETQLVQLPRPSGGLEALRMQVLPTAYRVTRTDRQCLLVIQFALVVLYRSCLRCRERERRKKKGVKRISPRNWTNGNVYYAPFSLCVHVTDTRAKIAAVPGVFVNGHTPWPVSIKIIFRFSQASLPTALSRAGKAV